jgi:hypothetical protein
MNDDEIDNRPQERANVPGTGADRPPMNRRAVAGIALAALVATPAFFLIPAFERPGVGFRPAFLGISAIEIACAVVVVVSVRGLYPEDYTPEYY